MFTLASWQFYSCLKFQIDHVENSNTIDRRHYIDSSFAESKYEKNIYYDGHALFTDIAIAIRLKVR